MVKEKTIKDPNQMIEAEIAKMLEILKNGSTNEQKRKARKEVLRLEKHLRDKENDIINGKKYPERLYHSDDKPMNKPEVLKLIDSVGDIRDMEEEREKFRPDMYDNTTVDLSGVSVGKNRFEFVELD